MKVSVKYFTLWTLFWVIFLILLIIFQSGLTFSTDDLIYNLENKKTFMEILINNSKNFLMYIVLFPINIILVFYDMLVIGLSIGLGYEIYDLEGLYSLLVPHSLIELPNLLFYSYLSFSLAKTFYFSPRLKTIIDHFYSNKRYYIFSYMLLIIAAWIEGV